jgi:cytochrome c oxidase subunit 4
MAHDSDETHRVGHIVPAKILIATGLGLLVLTVITVIAAKIDFAAYDLAELNIWVAMLIAVVKASLVCLFFMHLFWDRPFNSFVFISSIAFVAVFITFAMSDTAEYQNRINAGEPPAVELKLSELASEAE